MRRSPITLAAVPLALVAVLAAPALAGPGFDVGVRGMYWFPDLSAQVQTFTPGLTSPKFDVKNDLGVEDENFTAGEVFVRLGNVHFRLGYTPVSYDGNRRLTTDIVFNGKTFAVDTQVVSSLDVKMLDGEIQFDLLRPDIAAANFNIGLIAKVKIVDGTVELTSPGLAEKKDFKGPLPMIGAAAGIGLLKDLVRVDARLTGISYSGNRLIEGDIFASLAPFPLVRIQGGYRFVDLKIDESDDILAELKIKGPYIGAQVAF